MRGHDHLRRFAQVDRCAIRREVGRVRVGTRLVHTRQPIVRIGCRIPVAREVLEGADDARVGHAARHIAAEQADHVRIIAVGTHVDDGIQRIAVDVDHRRKVDVHADRRQLRGEHVPLAVGECRVGSPQVGGPERHAPGERRRTAARQPEHVAALLIDADQHADRRRRSDLRRQAVDLIDRHEIVGKQDHAADAVIAQRAGGGVGQHRHAVRAVGIGRRLAPVAERHHDLLPDLVARRHLPDDLQRLRLQLRVTGGFIVRRARGQRERHQPQRALPKNAQHLHRRPRPNGAPGRASRAAIRTDRTAVSPIAAHIRGRPGPIDQFEFVDSHCLA